MLQKLTGAAHILAASAAAAVAPCCSHVCSASAPGKVLMINVLMINVLLALHPSAVLSCMSRTTRVIRYHTVMRQGTAEQI